jgi:chromosome segregation ATPase
MTTTTTRTVAQIESDLAEHRALMSQPDVIGAALEGELEDARTEARNAEQIAGQQAWLAVQQTKADVARLAVGQLQFLVGEADAEIARLTATGDKLMARVSAGNATVIAAISAGDAAAAERNQAAVNDAGQALAKIPEMLSEALANKTAAEAQLQTPARDLANAESSVRNVAADIARLESLSGSGVPWDQPAPPAPPARRNVPSGLGVGGEMILRQRIEETTKAIYEPVVRWRGEPQIKPPRGRDKSWKLNKRWKR